MKTPTNFLIQSQFNTPLGPMIAIADDHHLYLLEFFDRHNLEKEITNLKKWKNTEIETSSNPLLESIKNEMDQYFQGTLKEFKTPIATLGSDFQELVWKELKNIPFGLIISYSELAISVGNPSACRAVAKANSTNQLAIIIPCHRVINKNKDLGGYAAGIDRKKWLLGHEHLHFSKK